MQFALVIHGADGPYQALTDEQRTQMYAQHERFGALLRERGALTGGAEFDIDNRIVRPDGDERIVTTGPYSETAEGIGGWYIVAADDIDVAAELATHLPILATDWVEVRPVK